MTRSGDEWLILGDKTFGADQGNKTASGDRGDDRDAVRVLDELKILRVARANGNDHAPAWAELMKERTRYLRGAGSDCDRVVGSVGDKSLAAVTQ